MNMFFLSFLIISQLVLQVIAAAEAFINPSVISDYLTYREGSVVSIVWNSTVDKIALTLWQDGNNTWEYIGGFSC